MTSSIAPTAACGRTAAPPLLTPRAVASGGGVLLATWLVRPDGVLLVAPLLFWLWQFAFFGGTVLRREPQRLRAFASAMLGCGAATALLPLSLLDVRDAPGVGARGTPLQRLPEGTDVWAVAGFPVRGIRGHGGGGWPEGWLGASDLLAHTANVALLAAACWLMLRWVPLRATLVTYWLGFVALLPASAYGYRCMLPYWD